MRTVVAIAREFHRCVLAVVLLVVGGVGGGST